MFRTLCSATPRPKCMRARVGFQKISELHASTRAKRALAEKPAVIARGWPNAVWPHCSHANSVKEFNAENYLW